MGNRIISMLRTAQRLIRTACLTFQIFPLRVHEKGRARSSHATAVLRLLCEKCSLFLPVVLFSSSPLEKFLAVRLRPSVRPSVDRPRPHDGRRRAAMGDHLSAYWWVAVGRSVELPQCNAVTSVKMGFIHPFLSSFPSSLYSLPPSLFPSLIHRCAI